jgi:3-keto-L-gulonate-6-phosphate decarboxylase
VRAITEAKKESIYIIIDMFNVPNSTKVVQGIKVKSDIVDSTMQSMSRSPLMHEATSL